MSRRLPLLALAGLGLTSLALAAQAATPSNGHVGPKHPATTYTTSMQVGSVFGIAGVEGVACPPASEDPADAVCDHYALTVDVPKSYWKSHHGGVLVTVPSSFYGYAYTPEGRLAAGVDWTGDDRQMLIPNASGPYEIRLAPYAAFGTSTVKVRFTTAKGADKPLKGTAFTAYHGKRIRQQPKALPSNSPIAYHGSKLAFRSTYVGRGAAEPTMGVDRHGNAFFVAAAFDALPAAAPKQEPRTIILRSKDANRSWQSVQPPLIPATNTDGHPVTMDPYTYVDPDFGRVFDIDLTLGGSYLSYSDDQGKTWTRGAAISVFGANDHQTLFTGKAPLGLPTRDPKFPKAVYYCVNQIDGSWCGRSLDGGKTFANTGSPPFPPATTDSRSGIPFCGGLHGHGITDSTGRIFLPRGFCNTPEVAISDDGGTTWQQVSLLNEGTNIGISGQQGSIAADGKDNLYYVWYDDVHKLPYLAVSRDHGQTWSAPRMIAPPGVKAVDFPSIDAGSPGHVAITFPGTLSTDATDLSRPWFSYVVTSTDALGSNPTFLSVVANPGGLADPVHRGDCDGRCGRMYDFLDVVIAPDAKGTIWATATDTCTKLYGCSTNRVAGYSSGSGEQGAADSRDGVAYMQVAGPRMR
jgi:hypothetical protein